MTCTCSRIRVGTSTTEHRNWEPTCPEHGLDSDWYKEYGKERFEERNRQAREMQEQARAARDAARAKRLKEASEIAQESEGGYWGTDE